MNLDQTGMEQPYGTASLRWFSHPHFLSRSFYYGSKTEMTTKLLNPIKTKKQYEDLMKRSRSMDFSSFANEFDRIFRGSGTKIEQLRFARASCNDVADAFIESNEHNLRMDKTIYLSRIALTQEVTLPVWKLLKLWKFSYGTAKPVVNLPLWAGWFWDVQLPHLNMDTVEEHLSCFECFQSSRVMSPARPMMICWHGEPALTWFTGCFHMQLICVRYTWAHFMRKKPTKGPIVMELINCRCPEDIYEIIQDLVQDHLREQGIRTWNDSWSKSRCFHLGQSR